MQWDSDWAIVSSRICTRADRVAMRHARKMYENGFRFTPSDTSLRLFIGRYIRNNPKVTDSQKKELGITVPDWAKSSGPGLLQTHELWGNVMYGSHLMHFNSITIAGRRSHALDESMKAIMVFIAFTDPFEQSAPPIESFAYDGLVKRGRYTRSFAPEHESKRAWYYAKAMYNGRTPTYSAPSNFWSACIM
ncbi:MAG: hypothetical protein WCQ95_10075 [Bacteroidota bacterium]